MNFDGINTPVYCGQSIRYFLSHASINIYQGQIPINLMKFFPHLKQGYALRRSLTSIMAAYTHANYLHDPNRKFIIPDKLFIESFGSDIPSEFYITNNQTRILMQTAIDKGLISNSLNTFQSIKLRYPDTFYSDKFPSYFINSMCGLNYYFKEQWPQINDYLQNEHLWQQLIIETNLIDEICHIYLLILRQNGWLSNYKFTLTDFIFFSIKEGRSLFCQHLFENKWIDVFNAIINEDIDKLLLLVGEIDPRSYSNVAYHLALKRHNRYIIDILSYNIIQRTWYERQVFSCCFELLMGYDTPAKEIHIYSRIGF